MDGYQMEVFAEARREGIVEDADSRRRLREARLDAALTPVQTERRTGAIGHALAWLARLARPAAVS
jgi:hypothetical protein